MFCDILGEYLEKVIEVLWVGKQDRQRRLDFTLLWIVSFVCLFIYLLILRFIYYEYAVAVFRHTRRGHQISLQMVVSHHVVAGN
jgi:hypothetical protein